MIDISERDINPPQAQFEVSRNYFHEDTFFCAFVLKETYLKFNLFTSLAILLLLFH